MLCAAAALKKKASKMHVYVKKCRLGRCYNIPVDVNGSTSSGLLCVLWVIFFVREKNNERGARESTGRSLVAWKAASIWESISDTGAIEREREGVQRGQQ